MIASAILTVALLGQCEGTITTAPDGSVFYLPYGCVAYPLYPPSATPYYWDGYGWRTRYTGSIWTGPRTWVNDFPVRDVRPYPWAFSRVKRRLFGDWR